MTCYKQPSTENIVIHYGAQWNLRRTLLKDIKGGGKTWDLHGKVFFLFRESVYNHAQKNFFPLLQSKIARRNDPSPPPVPPPLAISVAA